jgi:hypothetical protein
MKEVFKILVLVFAVGLFACSEDRPLNGSDGGQDGDGGGGTDGDCLVLGSDCTQNGQCCSDICEGGKCGTSGACDCAK